jgi:hypothetical protein
MQLLGLPLGLQPCNPLALVASPRLVLRQNMKPPKFQFAFLLHFDQFNAFKIQISIFIQYWFSLFDLS